MFPCLFQLVTRFLQCLECPKAHTQLMANKLVTALKFNTVVSLSFQQMHATAFSHSRCSSTIIERVIGNVVFRCPHSSSVSDPKIVPHGPLQTPLGD